VRSAGKARIVVQCKRFLTKQGGLDSSYKITSQRNTSRWIALFFFLDFKILTVFKNNSEDARIRNVSFHVLRNNHNVFGRYPSNRYTISYNRYFEQGVSLSRKRYNLQYSTFDFYVQIVNFLYCHISYLQNARSVSGMCHTRHINVCSVLT
jgi:hypothetical protein